MDGCRSSPKFWLSSWVMRWLPWQRSPEAWESGLWLREKHPWLQAICDRLLKRAWRQGDLEPPLPQTPIPKTHFLSLPRLSINHNGWGWALEYWQGTDMYPHQTPAPAPFRNKVLS